MRLSAGAIVPFVRAQYREDSPSDHVLNWQLSSDVLDRPDFNFRQLRSTVVVRWEYLPGSTVFAIWSHGQTSDAFSNGRFQVGRDLSELGTSPSEDMVMAKANYRIGL